MNQRGISYWLRGSALANVMLILTSLLTVLTVNAPGALATSASALTTSVSIEIVDSKWIMAPGKTFEVEVALINNDNIAQENIEIYAYIFDGLIALNEGGEFSNLKSENLQPNEIKIIKLPLTLNSSVAAGTYNLIARARLQDGSLNEDIENIAVVTSGIAARVKSDRVVHSGSPLLATVTIANLSPNDIENAILRVYLWDGQKMVSMGRNFFVDLDFTDNGISLSNTAVENGELKLARVPISGVTGVWPPAHIPGHGVGISATIAENNSISYIYALAGGGTTDFYRYNSESNVWQIMAPAPAAAGSGAALTTTTIGGSYIYALQGGDNTGFWRYRVDADIWEAQTSLPAPVASGGSLAWTGDNYVWALRGGSNELWRFDVSTSTWENMAPRYIFDRGASLVWGSDNYLFATKGGSSTTFYRYSIPANAWASVTDVPATVGAGGSLVRVGCYIYCVRGGGNIEFFRYDIAGNYWENLPSLPATIGYNSGNRLVSTGRDLYVIRGVTDGQVWRYNIANNRWTPANVPTYGNGASAVFADGYIYYAPSGGSNEFGSMIVLTTRGRTWHMHR